jgi:hypothetical protein
LPRPASTEAHPVGTTPTTSPAMSSRNATPESCQGLATAWSRNWSRSRISICPMPML